MKKNIWNEKKRGKKFGYTKKWSSNGNGIDHSTDMERKRECMYRRRGWVKKKQQQRKSEHYYRREKKICNKKASGAHTALQMIENEARAKKEINAHSNIVSFCPEPFARIQNV